MINLKDPSFVGMTKKSLTNSSWFEWLLVPQAVIPVTQVVIPSINFCDANKFFENDI